jgi:hypothetical protein
LHVTPCSRQLPGVAVGVGVAVDVAVGVAVDVAVGVAVGDLVGPARAGVTMITARISMYQIVGIAEIPI